MHVCVYEYVPTKAAVSPGPARGGFAKIPVDNFSWFVGDGDAR